MGNSELRTTVTAAAGGASTEVPADVPVAGPEQQARIDRALAELDLRDPTSVLFFGSKAQEKVTAISDTMLEGVRNKDTGAAGGALNEMVSTLRGFDVRKLDPTGKRGLLDRVLGTPKPLAKFLQRYEEVRRQIDSVTDRLDAHKTALMGDIIALDRLYDANLDYFHTLAAYIDAGETRLRELDERLIPTLAADADRTQDVIKAQQLRDLRGVRDDLERRVHDLKLTRQVAMQSLPSIRLVQQNDKSLINKITSVLANTVPLWRTQLAQSVTILRSREAGQALKEAGDLTNELLLANAENLRLGNAEIRREVDRGVFDIEAVKKANDLLIGTIEDSLALADEGRRRRGEAELQLRACEAELRQVLSAARARELAAGSSDRGGDRRQS